MNSPALAPFGTEPLDDPAAELDRVLGCAEPYNPKPRQKHRGAKTAAREEGAPGK